MPIKYSFPYSIPFSTKKGLITFGIILLLLVVAWILSYNDMLFNFKSFYVVWIGGPLSALYLSLQIWSIIERKAALRVDEKGIWQRFEYGGGRFVAWQDIESFKLVKKRYGSILFILVNNPEFYLAQKMDRNKMAVAKYAMEKHGTPVSLGMGYYDESPEEVLEVFEQGLKKFKTTE
ncbi:MAG: hypothetical protein IAF38_13745 [Bacteroidia bacterium]|nr:hypothetical protein [Bacteroidia bacterium]